MASKITPPPFAFCPLCKEQGKKCRMLLYDINLEEGVYLCSEESCPYPFGYEDFVFAKVDHLPYIEQLKINDELISMTPDTDTEVSPECMKNNSNVDVASANIMKAFPFLCSLAKPSIQMDDSKPQTEIIKPEVDVVHTVDPKVNRNDIVFTLKIDDIKEEIKPYGISLRLPDSVLPATKQISTKTVIEISDDESDSKKPIASVNKFLKTFKTVKKDLYKPENNTRMVCARNGEPLFLSKIKTILPEKIQEIDIENLKNPDKSIMKFNEVAASNPSIDVTPVPEGLNNDKNEYGSFKSIKIKNISKVKNYQNNPLTMIKNPKLIQKLKMLSKFSKIKSSDNAVQKNASQKNINLKIKPPSSDSKVSVILPSRNDGVLLKDSQQSPLNNLEIGLSDIARVSDNNYESIDSTSNGNSNVSNCSSAAVQESDETILSNMYSNLNSSSEMDANIEEVLSNNGCVLGDIPLDFKIDDDWVESFLA